MTLEVRGAGGNAYIAVINLYTARNQSRNPAPKCASSLDFSRLGGGTLLVSIVAGVVGTLVNRENFRVVRIAAKGTGVPVTPSNVLPRKPVPFMLLIETPRAE